jgi:serine/threonine protein kinase
VPQVRSLQPGDPNRLGSFAVTGRLGVGGQGTVYLGRAPDGQVVAIKVLHTRLAGDGTARSRFLREAAAARQVARFCTAQVIAADVAGDVPYIVSEYVPGRSLHTLVQQEGMRSGGDLERLAIGTATALVAIHKAGIVHRDLQPGNVLLGPDGPRVIDFGVARMADATATDNNGVIGTPAFMAPEQFSGDRIGPPADVFAWGATMVFAATGRPPFGADAIPAVVTQILHDQPDVGDMEQPLRDLVTAALAKDPLHRPTARELLDRLLGADAPATAPVNAPVATQTVTLAPAADARRRRRLLIAASAALSAALVTAVVLAAVRTGPGSGARSSAQGDVPSGSSEPAVVPSGAGPSRIPAKVTRPGAATGPGSAPAARTSRPARRPTRSPTPSPAGPTVLGTPDPAGYCGSLGYPTSAQYKDGSWRCFPKGSDPQQTEHPFTMTEACQWQYGPAAQARYNGGGSGTRDDYDCVKD